MSLCQAPLITFIVPCYNYGRYLPDCLDSIFNQMGGYHFEIIAIDDCSTDNTQDILSRYKDPRLQIMTHHTNAGHAATITEGLQAAKGDYVARIDPDDRYRPDFLALTVEKLNAYPEVGLVYGDAAIIDAQGELTQSTSDYFHKGHDFKGNELVALLEKNIICAPTVLARREAWLQALPIPEGLAFNDWYFTLLMARRYEFCYIAQVLAEYRVHSNNWHSQIAKNKREEPSIFRLLDQMYQEVELSPTLEAAKQQAKRRIYANHYRELGDKYFWYEHDKDARRCYWQALKHQPKYLSQMGIMRRLLATYLGRTTYTRLRDQVKAFVFIQ